MTTTPITRPEGITLVAIYHWVVGALGLLAAAALTVCAIVPVSAIVEEPRVLWLSLLFLGFGVLLSTVLGVAALVIGWGVLRLRRWARWAAIGLAIFSLAAFPLGTLCGGLTAWYLCRDDVRALFEVN